MLSAALGCCFVHGCSTSPAPPQQLESCSAPIDGAPSFALPAGDATLELTAYPIAVAWKRAGVAVLSTSDASPIAVTRPGATQDDPDVVTVGARASLLSRDGASLAFCVADANGKKIATLRARAVADGHASLVLEPIGATPRTYGFGFDLPSARHWYGQGTITNERNVPRRIASAAEQHFVLDRASFERPVLTSAEGSDVVTPLWMTATGGAIFSDSYSYLAVSWNRDANRRFDVALRPERGETSFRLDLLAAPTTRDVYDRWVREPWSVRPALPVGKRPDDDAFDKPTWTTWAAYHAEIDRAKVLSFAKDIVDVHGFPAGWLEIDDKWTPAYGDLSFAFPDAKAMIDELHGRGLKVSAWVPPYVERAAAAYGEGVIAQAFVEAEGSTDPAGIAWWNSVWQPTAAAIDFTRPAARAFWGKKVDAVRDATGVDGFKFDGGEAAFNPVDVRLEAGAHPNAYADAYARWALEHRGIEVRAAWFAQDVPILVRQFDKDSRWGTDNGLAAVLTQYLALGMIGYPFVLPDMVGGNEYGEKVDGELYVRWIELNAFLPFVQMSIPPWRAGFDADVETLTKKWLSARKALVPYFIALADEAKSTQRPIVRPLFFAFPEDESAYAIEDEMMLGDRYLVAPVLTKGATARDVYLPPGKWRRFFPGGAPSGEILDGGRTLTAFPAPLDAVPAFERILP